MSYDRKARKSGEAAGHVRDRLITAVVELVNQSGMDAVSVRQVATKAGVTGGTVQHYFPTKGDLLRAAMASVVAAYRARVTGVRRNREPADALRTMVYELVPLDYRRAVEARVGLAFLAAAAADPDLADVYHAGWQQTEEVFADLLAAARESTTAAERDHREDAALLVAVLDGLASVAVADPTRLPRDRISALVGAQLELLGVPAQPRPSGVESPGSAVLPD